jgi:hypothetical protein
LTDGHGNAIFDTLNVLRNKMNRQKVLSILPWITLGILIFPILWLLILLGMRMGFKLDMNYNEGWNVYYTVKAISGHLLYIQNSEWTSVNYPPLSFYIVGVVSKFVGDPLLSGRYISFLSLLVIAFLIGYLIIKLGGHIYAGIISGFVCLGLFITYARNYVGMNDPQMLGQAILIITLLIYFHKYFETNQQIFLGSLFIIIAIFIKHNLIALPVAIVVDLFFRSRQRLFKFILYLTIIGSCFTIITLIVSGQDFLNHLNSSRIYDFVKAKLAIQELIINLRLPLIAILPWIIYAIRNEQFRLVFLYLVFSLIIGTYASGGKGTNINMFFDVFISLSIAFGLMLSHFYNQVINRPLLSNLVLAILPIIIFSSMLKTFPSIINSQKNIYEDYKIQERTFQEDTIFLASKNEPIICERILLCNLAGKEFIYDPFLISNKIITDEINEKDILMKIESGWFKIIQLNRKVQDKYLINPTYVFPSTLPDIYARFTENLLRAIGKNYTLVRETSTGTFYQAKLEKNGV